MKPVVLPLLCLATFFAANDDRLWAQGPKDTDQRDRLIATILESQKSREVGAAYRSLFRLVGKPGLEALLQHENPGIAIQAAWELCLERVAVKDPRGDVQRFLGFVEGRTQLEIPLRWEVEVFKETVSRIPPKQRKALEPYLGIAPFLKRVEEVGLIEEPPAFKEGALGLSFPADVTVKSENGRIVLAHGKATVSVREDLFQELRRGASFLDDCSVMIGSKHSHIVLTDTVGGAFVLAQIESESGRLRWRVKGMAVGTDFPCAGRWYHWPILVSTEKHIAVFGIVARACYLEVYERDSGRCSYRFATNLWYVGKK
jgi:hypothetical protein